MTFWETVGAVIVGTCISYAIMGFTGAYYEIKKKHLQEQADEINRVE